MGGGSCSKPAQAHPPRGHGPHGHYPSSPSPPDGEHGARQAKNIAIAPKREGGRSHPGTDPAFLRVTHQRAEKTRPPAAEGYGYPRHSLFRRY